MKYQGNYFTGNLACQNLGDCSLCIIPTIPEKAKEQVKEKCIKKENLAQKLFKSKKIK